MNIYMICWGCSLYKAYKPKAILGISLDFQAMCRDITGLLGLLIEVVIFFNVEAQDTHDSNHGGKISVAAPSTGLVIMVLAFILTITVLLLAYVKFCGSNPNEFVNTGGLIRSQSAVSGIETTVIEALPFFRFSSIRGSKEGLECIVCISKFEEDDFLRMLPKCKHAFHMKCIDQWLASHSTCPLCRCKVNSEDVRSFACSFSSRLLPNPSDLSDDLNVDVIVWREQYADHHDSFAKFSTGSSFTFRNINESNNLKELLIGQEVSTSDNHDNHKQWHKFNHKIILSGVFTRNRWSDLHSSDLLSLESEMLNDASSRRFSNLESTNGGDSNHSYDDELGHRQLVDSKNRHDLHSAINIKEENSASVLRPAEKRSMSEITNVSRFIGTSMITRMKHNESDGKEEKLRRLWLPLAKGTIQWFVGREAKLQNQNYKIPSNV